MTVPHFLLGASLLFWGWQTGLMPLAVIMAALLEGARLMRSRINLSQVDFRRIADFNTVVFVAALFFVYLSRQSSRFIFTFLQWVPVALLPVILAQVYSTAGKIDPGAIFWSLRKPAGDGTPVMAALDLRYPYLFVVILSSGAANMRTPWFFAGACLLVAWSLWPFRNRRFSPALWIALLAAAALAGYGSQFGLNRLQLYLAEAVPQWLSSGDKPDTYRSMTAIGELGEIKLSDKILFRVETKPGQGPPRLLRRASFNTYVPSFPGTWVAAQTRFEQVDPEADGASWKFGAATNAREAVVTDSLREGRSVLKVPTGCFEIRDLPAGYLDRNIYGALRVYDGPGLVRYRVLYADDTVLDSPPGAGDLIIPDQVRHVISQVARELKLSGEPPAGVLAEIENFFHGHFSYSLVLRGGGERGALQEFLTRSRAGHCEFFATATVLLLREAGIPARYATGFSVQDFSRLEGCYVVRARHAHAWALAFVGGSWRDLDTTPAGWGEMEEQNAAWWTPLSDTWSWLAFKVSQWRRLEGERPEAGPVVWALLAAAALLCAVFLRRKSLTLIRNHPAKAQKTDLRPGLDSELYEIEKLLAGAGHIRRPWETISAWAARIAADVKIDPSILELHYRLRFDPAGLSATDRDALKEAVRSWMCRPK